MSTGDGIDPKAGERAYYARLGAAGLQHAAGKPFTDERCGHYLADIGALLQLLPPPPLRVLDLGCGTGWTSRFLSRAGYSVRALDIAPEAIAMARQLAEQEKNTRVEFAVGDYEDAGESGAFDVVLFYDALHHAEDEAAALRAAAQALKPGGLLVAFEPGDNHSRSETSRRAVADFGVHEKDVPPARIIALGREAGFGRALHLPVPHDLNQCLYRREYHEAVLHGRQWLEKLWGCYRVIGRLLRGQRQGGLTLLWKD